jgi:hypothetical protein
MAPPISISRSDSTPRLQDKDLPPIPEQKLNNLELKYKNLQEENRIFMFQLDIQADQIAKLNKIFFEEDQVGN